MNYTRTIFLTFLAGTIYDRHMAMYLQFRAAYLDSAQH